MSDFILEPFEETIAAGGYRRIDFYARMLTILSNSAGDKISVGIGEKKPVLLKAGLQYELPQGDTFKSLLIYNQAASETTVELILSDGIVHDNRLTISGSVFDNLLNELQGDTTAENAGRSTVGVAAVQIVAANADRKGIDIQADPANTDFIYLFTDNTVSTAIWFAKLSPGQGWSRDNYRGDVYAISGTAAQYTGYLEV